LDRIFTEGAFMVSKKTPETMEMILPVENLISHNSAVESDKYRTGSERGDLRRPSGVLGVRGLALEHMQMLSWRSLTPPRRPTSSMIFLVVDVATAMVRAIIGRIS
jgi:hypothetical protein